jgi:hypothetical protein
VYHEVFGYNEGVIRMWRKLGLSEEGILKGDRYWKGTYWDLHIFALYREAWPKVRDRVLRVPGANRQLQAPKPLTERKEGCPTEVLIPSNGCLSGAD